MISRLTIPTIFTAVDRFSQPVNRMGSTLSNFAHRTQRDFRNAGQAAYALGRTAGTVGLATLAPLAYMTKQAVEFEDRMTDVGKTTGLVGSDLSRFGNDILKMSRKTRTSIDELSTIAEIGGQLGVAKNDLLSFASAANKFNVALGKDFQGGTEEAITSIGKMATLFSDTKKLNISESIMRTGSAINHLGAMGAGTSANISDFVLRMGGLPNSLKATAASTIALGTYFEELGIDSRIASGGMTNLLLVAGQNIGRFATKMKISSAEAKKLLATDPTKFAQRFSASFEGMTPDKVAKSLQALKIGSQEAIKVVGALGNNQDMLNKLQAESKRAFEENTSLINEYNTKNNNAAATVAKFKNTAQSLSISLGNALLPTITKLAQDAIPLVDRFGRWIDRNKQLVATTLKLAAGFGAFSLAVSGIAFAFGTYQKFMVLANASSVAFTSGITMLKNGMVGARMATIALNGAFALTPFGMVAIGLTAIAAASYAVYNAYNKQSDAARVNSEVMSRTLSNTIDQRLEVRRLFSTLENVKVGTEKYTSALNRLNEMSPGIVQKYNLQYMAIRNLAGAEKDLIAQIIKRGQIQARIDILKEKQKQFEQNKIEGPALINRAAKAVFGWTGAKSGFELEQERLQKDISILSKQVMADSGILPDKEQKKKIDPFPYMGEIIKMMGGNIKSDVNVNITGAPEGSKVDVKGESKFNFALPKTNTTNGK